MTLPAFRLNRNSAGITCINSVTMSSLCCLQSWSLRIVSVECITLTRLPLDV
ncbi:unnamed protein product [Chondrus crispus]|uniref:Uncharacterized protein n=1 Tax=Chondrus crispus TaxID=2769 RepID=R7QRD6_CHOCR|nr:unnamed protein product [Chondrus crispus]CDF41042.1 unnamed protein product [Chondrus crispus]|eukprot:XP_005711336.1 unnamed protein product [Chondrus crispus]